MRFQLLFFSCRHVQIWARHILKSHLDLCGSSRSAVCMLHASLYMSIVVFFTLHKTCPSDRQSALDCNRQCRHVSVQVGFAHLKYCRGGYSCGFLPADNKGNPKKVGFKAWHVPSRSQIVVQEVAQQTRASSFPYAALFHVPM